MKKRIIIGIGVILAIIILCLGWYFFELRPVGKDNQIDLTIESKTSTVSIIKLLKDNNLIHNELATKIYIYLSNNDSLKAGTYEFNQNMSTQTIIKMIDNGEVKDDSITLSFIEGKKLVNYVKQISNAFGYSESSILSLMSSETYLNTLIDKYWFITSDILNTSLYYPLEGYLYPDTYTFKRDATIEEIITKILDNTSLKLTPLEESITNSKYNVHEILTLSSIIELEATTSADRKSVSGVFYNRLNNSWTLGSDVTAYYGAKKDLTDSITATELNECNSYNTRSTCLSGLPVGPICSPSIDAIDAAINPTASDYYFFVADTNSKVYFSKTATEQLDVIATLKSQNLWYND